MVQKSSYRKIGLIGEGQFGKVYSAINRYTGELLALKELNPQEISTKQFLKEIRILLKIQHPYVLRFYGIEHDKNKRYLITEYCEGGTLRDLLNQDQILSIEYKLSIIINILEGLNYIHQQDIIHRDLKPENILLSVKNQGWLPKISDFGVAKVREEELDYNSSTMGDTGSPAYMSPEQFYGKYSHQSDIYAMGIILLELLIGHRPFIGSPSEIMLGHLNQVPTIPETIPDFLQVIILKALEKLPARRFRTAQEMRTEILNATLNLSASNNSFFDRIPYKLLDFDLIDNQEIDENINCLVLNDSYIYEVTTKDLIINLFNFDLETKKIIIETQNLCSLDSEIID